MICYNEQRKPCFHRAHSSREATTLFRLCVVCVERSPPRFKSFIQWGGPVRTAVWRSDGLMGKTKSPRSHVGCSAKRLHGYAPRGTRQWRQATLSLTKNAPEPLTTDGVRINSVYISQLPGGCGAASYQLHGFITYYIQPIQLLARWRPGRPACF